MAIISNPQHDIMEPNVGDVVSPEPGRLVAGRQLVASVEAFHDSVGRIGHNARFLFNSDAAVILILVAHDDRQNQAFRPNSIPTVSY